MLCAIQTSRDSLPSAVRVSPRLRPGMKLRKAFFKVRRHVFPSFFTSHSLPRHHAERLSKAAWRPICSRASRSSVPTVPSYSLFSFNHIFRTCAVHWHSICSSSMRDNFISCMYFYIFSFHSVLEYVASLWSVISNLWDMQSQFGLLDSLSAVTNNCWAATTAADCHAERSL